MPDQPDFKPPAMEPGATPFHLAAVDLGSNTFHLLVARLDQGEPRVVERVKFRVGLAAGLGEDGTLDAAVFERGVDALRRIADRSGGIPRANVRAVGTSTIRHLADMCGFIEAAEDILRVPLRVISGEEEARLSFVGATDTLPESDRQRLVVDIGGGSTELALGSGHAAQHCFSLEVGCVGISRIALAADSPAAGFDLALAEARARCEDAGLDPYRGLADTEVIGVSGTIESIRDVLRARGHPDAAISPGGLRELCEVVRSAPRLPIALPGLVADREDVFAGGLAILVALFERLQIDGLTWTEGALQDGVMRELVPLPEEGLRTRTLAALQARFSVDPVHARQVHDVALALHASLAGELELTPADGKLLAAAATVHDLGLAVASPHHERHGAWLLRNAELRGFTFAERMILIALVRGHRGAWPQTAISALEEPLRVPCARLCVLLRLAVILKRAEGDPLPRMTASAERIEIRPDDAWSSAHPYLMDALTAESGHLAGVPHAPAVVVA